MKKNLIYPVFFQDSYGKEHAVAEVQNMKEAFAAIREFCHERNYDIQYTRFWLEPYESNECPDAYRLVFDVGSWSEFFNIYFDNEYQANQFRDTFEFEKPF